MDAIPASSYPLPLSDDDPQIIEPPIHDGHPHTGATPQRQLQEQKLDIQRLNGRVAPIHCLIDDVLLRIFTFLAHIPPPPDLLLLWYRKRPAVTLSRVCKRWRALVISSPQLWTKFFINWMQQRRFHDIGHDPHSFLSRSSRLPLDIFIYSDRERLSPWSSPGSRMVADALLSSVARWKSAWFDLPWPSDALELSQVLQCSPASYAQLETLNISVELELLSGRLDGSAQRFDELPILRAPLLKNLTMDEWQSTWVIPSSWRQLRELNLQMVDSMSLSALMCGCPNLSKITANIFENFSALSPIAHRTHNALTTLLISWITPNIPLFSIPHTPAVQTLCFVWKVAQNSVLDEAGIIRSHLSILHIVQSCASSLVDLTLHHCIFRDNDLTQILQLLTNLQKLDVDAKSTALTSNVFRRLTPGSSLQSGGSYASGLEVLCPNISSLRVRVRVDELSMADEQIEAMFSLIAGLIARGVSSVRITSDSWATVEGYDNWMAVVPAAALEEGWVRELKKREVERRIGEMRDLSGVRGLRLERDDKVLMWRREDLMQSDGSVPNGLVLVGNVLAYDSPQV